MSSGCPHCTSSKILWERTLLCKVWRILTGLVWRVFMATFPTTPKLTSSQGLAAHSAKITINHSRSSKKTNGTIFKLTSRVPAAFDVSSGPALDSYCLLLSLHEAKPEACERHPRILVLAIVFLSDQVGNHMLLKADSSTCSAKLQEKGYPKRFFAFILCILSEERSSPDICAAPQSCCFPPPLQSASARRGWERNNLPEFVQNFLTNTNFPMIPVKEI